ITSLRIDKVTDDRLAELIARPWLTNIRDLVLVPPLLFQPGMPAADVPDWGRLADASPGRLTALQLYHGEITHSSADRLASAPALANLRVLGMGDTVLSGEAAERLFNRPVFEELRGLSIHRCGLGIAGVEAISGCEQLARLEALSLSELTLA